MEVRLLNFPLDGDSIHIVPRVGQSGIEIVCYTHENRVLRLTVPQLEQLYKTALAFEILQQQERGNKK